MEPTLDSVLRAAAIYAFLVVLFRVAGRRTLSEMTSFDFVLLLVVGEATQQALLGEDFSLTNAFLSILTLIAIDIGLSLWKQRSTWLEMWIDGVPTVLVEDGRPLRDRMDKARVGLDDILEAARRLRGLERLEQVRYAILERDGKITIIPRPPEG
nr:YetF domain-containing protein [Tautonia plasticadhaerens]